MASQTLCDAVNYQPDLCNLMQNSRNKLLTVRLYCTVLYCTVLYCVQLQSSQCTLIILKLMKAIKLISVVFSNDSVIVLLGLNLHGIATSIMAIYI